MTIEKAVVSGEWTGRGGTPAAPSTGRLRPLGLHEVTLRPGFWQQRQHTSRTASFDHIEHWLERAGWLGNFGAPVEGRRGREFSDSEVYKYLEALAWAGDPAYEDRFHAIVARVAAVQQPDGYLNTNFGRPGQAARYSDLEWGHELYCYGHLIQAGVARARTHGHDDLVTVAVRAADHVCDTFGPDGIQSVCGHAEIEPALVELYRVTGNRRYLDQARLFVERRGRQVLDDIEFGRAYFQDDMPIREARVLRGHAVRAVYLASGAVDVAVETGDTELLEAVARQWRATVARRTYLTGGIGSRHQDEAFGDDFVLPPDRAYQETCAGVGSVMLAWRLLLAEGNPRYADLIERVLFNIIATSPSDDGTRFFYTNTLHQRVPGIEPAADTLVPRAASSLRAPWYAVSCCMTNLARTFSSLAAYLATTDDDGGVQIHQYTPASIRVGDIDLDIETAYPADGRVTIRVVSAPATAWTLSLRIPHWATEATLDGVPVAPGLAAVRRRFTAGDMLVLDLAVRPRLTFADARIDAVRGSVAVERGPVVYCLESLDLPPGRTVDTVRLDPATEPVDRDGAVIVTGRTQPVHDASWPYGPAPAPPLADAVEIPLYPYHRWARRGPSTMRVWLPLDRR
ncbi:glycoside hydrolase family 127 protein [Actinoplanes flavus]|uniref:glycoside hydrolase family 127 protein n=1 Tax=Actinoplanes flavus TaxID=2820290 RepID=UPI0027DB5F87|nr:beta-L-arabinofuranosidase domain-containing protein [Actinoplanes flavus]